MSRLAWPIRLIQAAGCVLAFFAIRQIPPLRTLVRADPTPFDTGPVSSVAPAYSLLRAAARVVPQHASVLARSEPRDPKADTYFYRAAVAMLPHRSVLPAAEKFSVPTSYEETVRFVIILGRVIEYPGFRRVLETPHGSVWRRSG